MSIESPTVRRLLDRWEKEKVLYCHWKSSDHMEAALCGQTDLDVLVATEDSGKTEVAAIAEGFVLMQTAKLRQYPGIHDYVAYDENIDKFVHLHLHYQLVVGDRWVKAYRLPFEHGLLERRRWSSSYNTWIVSPEDEISLFCARMCVKFKKPFSKEKLLSEAEYLAKRVNEVEDVHLTKEYPQSVIDLAVYLVTNGVRSVSDDMVISIRKDMQQYLRMTWQQFRLMNFIRFGYRLAVEFNRRILGNFGRGRRRLHTGGITVAFIGMDGAGKTSAVERSKLFFSQQMDVEPIFLGSGVSGAPWYRRLAFVILGTRAKSKKHKRAREVGQQPVNVPFYYLIWNLACARDRIARLKQAFRYRSSGILVFVDRWPQNTLKKGFDSRSLHNISNKSLLAKYAISKEDCVMRLANDFWPDLVFRFKVSPVVAVQRKPSDLNLEQAEQMQRDLVKIEWPKHSVVVDVDANLPMKEVDLFIRGKIWSVITGKI